jgi:hypothetical protein
MLAEHLLSARLKALNEMLLPETPFTSTLFTNLGYIPGGITGLRAFAENPSQILPRSLSGKKAWDSEPLTSEATLVSFNLVLVITENPDTARAWVEQAQAKLENTPLLMVISAQAEPMVRPYYDSGQIDGLVTGIAGSVAYENLVGQSGPASTYWDSLSASLLVAVVLILGGGLTNAILGVLARSKQKGEEHPYA